MGYSNLNFYNILSRNDAMILRQSSRIFQSYSPLYNINQEGVNVNNLVKEEQNNNLIKCLIFEDVQNPFSEDILFNGHVIGKIEGLIEVKKIPLIKQIMCGVHTENGFDISSVYLYNIPSLLAPPLRDSHEKDVPNELRVLISQKNNLLEKVFPSTLKNLEDKLNEKQLGSEASNIIKHSFTLDRKRNLHPQNLSIDTKATLNILNEIKNTLKKSCKESLLIYNLNSSSNILLAQREMIDLGINTINILSKEDIIDTRRSVLFEILILLFNRAEIDLRLMAFDFKVEPSIDKLEICKMFIEFLNKTLCYCLEKLAGGTSADLDTNEFVEFFLSVGYFRIPIFRRWFINAINKGIPESDTKEIFRILEKDENLTGDLLTKTSSRVNWNEYSQLQSTDVVFSKIKSNNDLSQDEVNLQKLKQRENEEAANNAIDVNPVNSLIDWETLFYERIEKLADTNDANISREVQEIFEKMKETENIINRLEWKGRISKRGNAFFSMIIRLEKYIQSKVIILRNLRWVKIPGFKFIINAIIHELKKREVSQYQEPLVRLLTIFINDSDISNLFINTIIRRTK